MTLVVVVAVAGLIALLAAIVTDSTAVAVAVIVLALAGILLLLRDWRAERHRAARPSADSTGPGERSPDISAAAPLSPDLFAPDIAADGGGPSSDARAD